MRVFYVDDFFSLGYNMFLYHVLVTWWSHSQPLQVKERQSSGWFKCPTASKSASPLCSNCCPIVLYYRWKKKLFASSVGVNLNDLRSEVGYLRFHMATMHLIWYIWLVLLFSYNFFFSLFVATHKKGKTICHNKTYKPITLVKNDASLTQFWYLEAIAYTTTMIVCSYMF